MRPAGMNVAENGCAAGVDRGSRPVRWVRSGVYTETDSRRRPYRLSATSSHKRRPFLATVRSGVRTGPAVWQLRTEGPPNMCTAFRGVRTSPTQTGLCAPLDDPHRVQSVARRRGRGTASHGRSPLSRLHLVYTETAHSRTYRRPHQVVLFGLQTAYFAGATASQRYGYCPAPHRLCRSHWTRRLSGSYHGSYQWLARWG